MRGACALLVERDPRVVCCRQAACRNCQDRGEDPAVLREIPARYVGFRASQPAGRCHVPAGRTLPGISTALSKVSVVLVIQLVRRGLYGAARRSRNTPLGSQTGFGQASCLVLLRNRSRESFAHSMKRSRCGGLVFPSRRRGRILLPGNASVRRPRYGLSSSMLRAARVTSSSYGAASARQPTTSMSR